MLALYNFQLLSKYSAILSSSLITFFLCYCSHVSSIKNSFSSTNVKRNRLFLQALHIHMNSLFGLLCRDEAITLKKIIPKWQDSSSVKARSPLWKSTRLTQTKYFTHVIKNVFLNGKDYFRGLSSKHPVLAKRNKFPQIISIKGFWLLKHLILKHFNLITCTTISC